MCIHVHTVYMYPVYKYVCVHACTVLVAQIDRQRERERERDKTLIFNFLK